MGEHPINKSLNVVLTILYLLVVIGMSYMTQASPGLVFLGTSPLLLHLITINLIHGDIQGAKTIFWGSAIIYPALFFMLWNSGSVAYLTPLSGVELTAFNVVIALIFNLIVVLFYVSKKKSFLGKSKDSLRYHHTFKKSIFDKAKQKPHHGAHNKNETDSKGASTITRAHASTSTSTQTKPASTQGSPHTAPEHEVIKKRRMAEHLRKTSEIANHIRKAERLAHQHYQAAKKFNERNKVYKQYIKDIHDKHHEIVGNLHAHHKSQVERLQQELEKAKSELHVNQNNFQVTLRSIEDKCKALNFVIGRVYSNKHGANDEIRELLKIDKELYNLFSEISSNFDKEKARNLYTVIYQLYQKIKLLDQPEKLLFKMDPEPKIPIDRDRNGNDKILDVLVRNDKDPVMGYYEGAKEICEKLMRYLLDEYLK